MMTSKSKTNHMFHLAVLALLMLLLTAHALPVQAHALPVQAHALPVQAHALPVQAQDTQWQATYWNNRNLAGEPVLQRQEVDINFDWGESSPHELVNIDDFSARWERTVFLPIGNYRFTATVDDGMRVWVGDVLLIDIWHDSQVRSVSADIFLLEGNHHIRVEYYDAGGDAIAQLSRQLISGFQNNWLARYYNNTTLSGEPVLVRHEAQIDFRLSAAPAPQVSADHFSVRWTQDLSLDAGRYRFTVTADDGVRLWVNNQMVLDEWRDQPETTYAVEVEVPGGLVPVRMEYYENRGDAIAQLSWTQISAIAPPPSTTAGWRAEYYNNVSLSDTPVLVRYDPDINFSWGSSSPAPDIVDADRFSVRWSQTFNLAPGRYELTLYVDDGARLWAGSRLLIDAWFVQSASAYEAAFDHAGGPLPIVVEYFENTGLAEARLVWSPTPGPPADDDGMATATMTGALYLNVRAGPGLEFEPFTVLQRDQVVPIVGRDRFAIWIEVQLPDGQTGWVSGRYLISSTPFVNLPVTG